MVTFILGLIILAVGAVVYGKFCEKVFGPDNRETPAYTKQDGVDYVPMKSRKNMLINLWRYFAWSNQTLSLFAFLAIAVWMFENGKGKYAWIPMIPGGFYAFVAVTYIVNAKIGFGMPWGVSYVVGGIACVAYVAAVIWYGKKRGCALKK